MGFQRKKTPFRSHLTQKLIKTLYFLEAPEAFKNLLITEISHEKFVNTGRITLVEFWVEKDGKMNNIRVNSPHEDVRKELLIVFQKISLQYKWEPAELNGEKVRRQMRQPVNIY